MDVRVQTLCRDFVEQAWQIVAEGPFSELCLAISLMKQERLQVELDGLPKQEGPNDGKACLPRDVVELDSVTEASEVPHALGMQGPNTSSDSGNMDACHCFT